jgi:AraC family transcriptional regulator
MEWQPRMAAALAAMEAQLDGDVDWAAVAAAAHCSLFHFFRMFQVVAGVPPAEYVRRRRLSIAALALAAGEVKVIDLALQSGYESPDAFARAFKREFGCTPTEARQPGSRLKTWPRLSFSIALKGGTPMDFRVENREAMKLTGLRLATTMENGRQFEQIPAFWDRAMKSGAFDQLLRAMPKDSQIGVAGVSADMTPDSQEFSYLIAIEAPSDRSLLPDGCIDLATRAGTWAIFESRGPLPGAIQNAIKRIYEEWFPSSGYEHAGGPELEVYPPGDTSAADYYAEIWIPVVKAARD